MYEWEGVSVLMEMQVEEGWGRVEATCFSPLALSLWGRGPGHRIYRVTSHLLSISDTICLK